MSGAENHASVAFDASAGKRLTKEAGRKSRTASSPVTLRLTPDERAQLEQLADGMTLSAYIRFCVFSEGEAKRRRRPRTFLEDRKSLAQALALLGQSRIANNLNQLAYQANIGALVIDETARDQIDETYRHIAELRSLILKALRTSR